MKRKWIVSVLALIFAMVAAACNAGTGTQSGTEQKTENTERETLVICVESENFLYNTNFEEKLQEYVTLDCDIELRPLPEEGAERQAYCDRIRIELMSGGGPDLFIVDSTNMDDSIFPHVEKTMRAGYFLPLDDYIENWENDLFEKQVDVIMDAGKTEEGQVVLPLVYRLPLYVVEQNDVLDTQGPFTSWEALTAAAEQDAAIAAALKRQCYDWFPMRFARLGDYDAEKLTVTQEEMQTVLQQVKDLGKQESVYSEYLQYAAPGESITLDEETTQEINSSTGWSIYDGAMKELTGDEPRSVLTVYNTEGGLTAQILAFAVVNRNSYLPEEAVKAASVLYNDVFHDVDDGEYLGFGFGGVTTSEDDVYAEQLAPYLEQVNAVRFYSEFDFSLFLATGDVDEEDPAEIAEDLVTEMKMIMAE